MTIHKVCRGCTKRYLACHDHCPEYLAETEAIQKEREAAENDRSLDRYIAGRNAKIRSLNASYKQSLRRRGGKNGHYGSGR